MEQDNNSFSFASQAENDFDSHIQNSIPGYNTLADMAVNFSDYFVNNNTHVLDIGCTTGTLLNRIFERQNLIGHDNVYSGVDIVPGFIEQAQAVHGCGPEFEIDWVCKDIGEYFKSHNFNDYSYVLCIFTLQFISDIDLRLNLIQTIYNRLNPGGALFIAEKLYSETGKMQNIVTFPYYDYKLNSFSEKEILDKERSLRHMLRCTTESDLLAQMTEAGFKNNNIQCVWRNYNFAGYIAIKE